MLNLKDMTKLILTKFDLEIRRSSRYYIDAFGDQKKLINKQDISVIFDVGANIGQSVAVYRKLFPKSNIYCFEPTDDAFNDLYNAYKNCDFVKPYRMAVSSENGFKEFFLNRESVTNSLLPTTEKVSNFIASCWTENIQNTKVETVTIDDFCISKKIEKIDILKMDIQGGEFMALKGANGLLQRQAINLIYTEVLFGNAYQGQGYFHDLCNLLIQYGYTLYGIYNLVRAANGTLYQGDAIFISPDIEGQLANYICA